MSQKQQAERRLEVECLPLPQLHKKIDLLRKRWWQLWRAEVDMRDFDRTKQGINLAVRAVDEARENLFDAVREFFYEEMGGGQS